MDKMLEMIHDDGGDDDRDDEDDGWVDRFQLA